MTHTIKIQITQPGLVISSFFPNNIDLVGKNICKISIIVTMQYPPPPKKQAHYPIQILEYP